MSEPVDRSIDGFVEHRSHVVNGRALRSKKEDKASLHFLPGTTIKRAIKPISMSSISKSLEKSIISRRSIYIYIFKHVILLTILEVRPKSKSQPG